MSAVRRVHVHGPLADFADGFEAELERQGFAPLSRVDQLRLMAHLRRRLDAEQVVVGAMSAGHVEAFLHERRSTRAARFARQALRPLLDCLAMCGAIPVHVSRPVVDRDLLVLGQFGNTLRAFLRFCFLIGLIDRDLTGATLVTRSPQPSLLPVGVSPAEISALLGVCDRKRHWAAGSTR
jgi:hypothetical protein